MCIVHSRINYYLRSLVLHSVSEKIELIKNENTKFETLKARFHYERRKVYSLFVLLIFFALLSARFNFKRGKINKRKKKFSTLVVETGL